MLIRLFYNVIPNVLNTKNRPWLHTATSCQDLRFKGVWTINAGCCFTFRRIPMGHFIVRTQHMIHTTYKMCVNRPFKDSIRLRVNRRLSAVKLWGNQNLHTDLGLWDRLVPPTLALFKAQMYTESNNTETCLLNLALVERGYLSSKVEPPLRTYTDL